LERYTGLVLEIFNLWHPHLYNFETFAVLLGAELLIIIIPTLMGRLRIFYLTIIKYDDNDQA
jgi:hypothetical protein